MKWFDQRRCSIARTDLARLRHILDAARQIGNLVAGFDSGEEFLNAFPNFWATVKMIEIIGEAAARMSEEVRNSIALPWREIIATRNFLIHAYFDVNAEIVWKTATADIPKVRAAIETYLSRKDVP